jgi:hypothetical protein
MPGKLLHLIWQLKVRYVLEIRFVVANFVRLVKRRREQPFVPSLDHYRTLAVRKHHAPDGDHVLVADSIADDGERIQPGLAIRRDVIGRVQVAVAYFGSRRETVDVDGVRASILILSSSSSSTSTSRMRDGLGPLLLGTNELP